MPTTKLFIDIQEGLQNDTVIIKINRKKIYEKTKLTTSLLTGPTDKITTQVQQEPTTIEVIIPTKNLTEKITLTPKDDTYLGISIAQNPNEQPKIRILTQQQPFGYL